MKDHALVVKSNKMIEASYRLTLNEQRLILACIALIQKGQAISVHDQFVLSAAEFASVFQVPLDRAYGELQAVAERLYERSVTIETPDPDNPRVTHTKTRWVTSIDYIPGAGQLILRFASRIIPYISLLEVSFTPYRLESVANMSSIYGIRIYELLFQWRSVGEREIALSDLKKMLGLEEQYSAIKDFKLRVLEPALRDINTHSDLKASYTQRKSGRVITHLIFKFSSKQPPKDNKRPHKITKAEIERVARPGETYEQVEARLLETYKQGS